MDIVTDYANWKFENSNLIESLLKNKSKIIERFHHVFLVADFYYEKVVNDKEELSEDDEVIFQTAFIYLHEHINTIDIILEQYFNKDINKMEEVGKTIALLLLINDVQNELENDDELDNPKNHKLLSDIEQRLYKYIETHTNAPDSMYGEISDLISSLYDEYYDECEILLEAAIELGLELQDEE